MAFDGIITKSVINELNPHLLNGKITKVFQPNKNDIVLGIYSQGKNYALEICINASSCRVNLTTHSKPNPLNAPNFCMFLRKHLIGCRIKNISTVGLERVITIDLDGYNELNDLVTNKLIIELMGKHSNLILINSNNIILDSLRHIDKDNSLREILPAHPYVSIISEKQDFTSLSNFDEFYLNVSNSTQNIDKTISQHFIGISQLFVQYVCYKLHISLQPSKDELVLLYTEIKDIINSIGSNKLNCINFQNDYTIDKTDSYKNLDINFFLDDYYFEKENKEAFISYRNNILRLLQDYLRKYEKRLSNINQKLIECDKMPIYKLYGELLTANLYRIKDEHIDKICLENYYENNNLITIPLDKTISPSNNAKKYFKKYAKLKNTLEIVSVQKANTKKEIDYIESIVYSLENAITIEDIDSVYSEISETIFVNNKPSKKKSQNKQKGKSSISFIEYVVDGYTLLVGKNNKQNDILTLKLASKNDIWFHTKDIQGSHAVLKTNEDEISFDTLFKCASIAAYHSKAKNSSNVPVDYTFVRNVKKPNGAKPGMVIYTNNKTIYANPVNSIEEYNFHII